MAANTIIKLAYKGHALGMTNKKERNRIERNDKCAPSRKL